MLLAKQLLLFGHKHHQEESLLAPQKNPNLPLTAKGAAIAPSFRYVKTMIVNVGSPTIIVERNVLVLAVAAKTVNLQLVSLPRKSPFNDHQSG